MLTWSDRVDRVVVFRAPAVVRWVAGLLWLSNVSWKVPSAFGRVGDRCGGLCRYVEEGVDHPVFPGSGALFDNLVGPNLAAFGWLTLFVEAALAASLLAGVFTRTAAIVGIAQSIGIMASVANADGEWYWSYLLMAALHLAVLVFAPATKPLHHRAAGCVLIAYGVLVAITHAGEGFTGTGFTFFADGDKFPGDFWKNVFPGSVALGAIIVGVGIGLVLAITTTAFLHRSRQAGSVFLAVAAGLLVSYDNDGLLIGLGSRASTAAMLAMVGGSLIVGATPLEHEDASG